MLIVVGGLPATGKTTVSRAAARKPGAAYLRIDTIEQAFVRFAGREKPGDELRHAVTGDSGATSPTRSPGACSPGQAAFSPSTACRGRNLATCRVPTAASAAQRATTSTAARTRR